MTVAGDEAGYTLQLSVHCDRTSIPLIAMPDSVTQWLEQLGLGEYAEAFNENSVDWKTLPELDHELLKEVGVKAVGHRVAILKAIESLNVEPETAHDAASVASPPTPTMEAERRQLTVMFCDLVGSTELSQKLDPEDLREINRAYQDACKTAIERYEGYVARYMGDGVLAYFGYPIAHEEDAERAVHAGLGVVESVAELSAAVGDKQGVDLRVRVGITTGPVVVGDLIGEGASQESTVVGETPNLAARLQALATPNAVVVGPGTHELAAGQFEYEDIGDHEFKGIAEPVHAWRVIAPTTAESRFEAAHRTGLTPLVGREHEIGLLLERWEQAKEGDGQVVLLSGEAGIGKSRITETLQERTAGDAPIRLRYQCSPYHTNSALHPVIEQLERAAQFDSEDMNEAKLNKLESLLALGASDVEAVAPHFALLMSISLEGRYPAPEMTPDRQKEQSLEALVAQMEGLSRNQPVLFMFEDTHWADPTSLELLELIVGRAQSLPVLVIITFRPDFPPPWTGYTHVTSLTLNRFTRRLAAAMVGKITGGKVLPDEVLEQIIVKTDGVPLFVEELTKTILESGLLAEEQDKYVHAGPVPEIAIPATLHDSLMARLDRLGAVKEVAQTAAAIGREFDYDLLAAVSPLSFAELGDALRRLIDAGLVFGRGRSLERGYIFKHALVQNAAYGSLLKSRRQQVHARIAEVLERRFPERAETEPEILAHHLTEAGMTEPAIPYLEKAGLRAIERSANLEAVTHLRKALQLLEGLPESAQKRQQELELCLALGPTLMATFGLAAPEARKTYLRARELCVEVGEQSKLFRVVWGLWLIHQQSGEIDPAEQRSAEVLALADKTQDLSHRLQAHHTAWTTSVFGGDLSECYQHTEQGAKLYDVQAHRKHAFLYGGHDPGVCALTTASEVLWLLGYPDKALEKVRASVILAEQLLHPFSLAMAHYFVAQLHHFRRDTHDVGSCSEEATTLCDKYDIAHFGAQSRILRGWSQVVLGEYREGLKKIRSALSAWEKTGAKLRRSYYFAVLAEAYLHVGRIEEGLSALSEAFDFVTTYREQRWESELYRLKGELLVLPSSLANEDEAEVCITTAIDAARKQEAKSLELRASMSLARLWQNRGECKEAHALLVPVHSWFTEGFDTPDLKDAKVLLEQLS